MVIALEMIPVQNKKEYLEAVRLAPKLIKTESDPVKFLRVEDFNPWMSAKRLILYWEYRKKWFQNRWLLPLNNTGAGALDKDDCDLLRSGWVSYVTPSDPTKGRYFLINHSKFPLQPMESRMRVVFYLCSMASDKSAQTVGLRGIRLVPTTEVAFTKPRLNNARLFLTMTRDALPVRFRGMLILDLEKDGMHRLMNLGFNQFSTLFNAFLNLQDRFKLPIADVLDAAETLKEHGVPPDAVPVDHGGSWNYDQMFDWKRVVAEQDDVAKYVKIPWIMVDANPDDDKTKQVNALYARRAYHKRKLKLDQNQEEVKRLRTENERLRNENAFLESLLQQASEVLVAVVEDLAPGLPDFEVGDEAFENPFETLGTDTNANFGLSLQHIFD